MILIVFLLKIFFNGLFPLKCLSITLRKYLAILIVDNLQKKWGVEPYYISFPVFSFIISPAAIIVIPITSVNQPTIYLTLHNPTITIIIIIVVVNVAIVIVFIVTSLKIIFKSI